MTKEQVEKKKAMYRKDREAVMKNLCDVIFEAPWFVKWSEEDRFNAFLLENVRIECRFGEDFIPASIHNLLSFYLRDRLDEETYKEDVEKDGALWDFIRNDLRVDMICEEKHMKAIEGLLDSEPVEFDGDIMITDPCYFIKGEEEWTRFCKDKDLSRLGLSSCMVRDTIFGDWTCAAIDTDTGERIGSFCADSGLVSVTLLDEVLRYNPDFVRHLKKDHTITVIQDFSGTVKFVVKEYVSDRDGKTIVDHRVEVIGHGVNRKTKENINFVGTMYFSDEEED